MNGLTLVAAGAGLSDGSSQIEYLVIFSNESPRTAVFGGQVTFGLVGGLDFSYSYFSLKVRYLHVLARIRWERERTRACWSSIHTKCIIIGISRESKHLWKRRGPATSKREVLRFMAGVRCAYASLLSDFFLKLLMATRVRLWPYMVKEYPHHHHARPYHLVYSLYCWALSSHGSQRNLVLYKFPHHHHISAFHLSLSIYWHFFTSSSSSHSSFLSFTAAALPHDFLGATTDWLRDSTVRLNHLGLYSLNVQHDIYTPAPTLIIFAIHIFRAIESFWRRSFGCWSWCNTHHIFGWFIHSSITSADGMYNKQSDYSIYIAGVVPRIPAQSPWRVLEN